MNPYFPWSRHNLRTGDTVTARRKIPPMAEFEPAMVCVATNPLVRSANPFPYIYIYYV